MIYLRADGRKASITKDQPITTGSVGMKVDVSLSEDYDGLSSVVVFTAGSVSADVMYVGEPIEVPSQVLLEPGMPLHVGVYGQSADGRIAIPTVWAAAGVIQIGTKPSGIDPAEPTPSWAAQVQQWAEEAHDTAERLAEEVDGWEADENERISAESAREAAEASRARAEAARYSNESTRATNEASRVLAEQDRQSAEAERASAESSRVAAEASRANAETARADAETGRASAESQRASAEAERKSAESGRASAESSRRTAESARASAEQSRITAEQARALAEQARGEAESAREDAESDRETEWATLRAGAISATSAASDAASSASEIDAAVRSAEQARVAAESSRASAESARETAEQSRQGAEDARSAAEASRVQAESQRASSESQRASAEQSRASAETARATAEQARATAESGRVAAESSRVTAESERSQEWDDLTQDVQDAIDAATEAAESVSDDVDALYNGNVQLFGNQLTGTLSGTIDTASDAYAAPPMALTVDGKSTQATTTGKNLFNKDNTPRGYYNNSGEFVANNTYVWWSVPVSEGDVIRYTNCAYCTMTHWYNGAYVDHSPQTWGATFTVPSGIDEIRGYSGTSTLDTAVVTKNNADLTYEPYTGGKPTPRPDYPQPILSVDDLSLCMCGINRMYIDSSASGITVQDGVYEGKVVDLNSALRCPYPIPSGSAFTVDVRAVESGTGNLNFIAVRKDTGGLLYMASPPNTQTTWATYTYAINYPVSEIYLYHNASGNRVWQFRNLCVRADGSTAYEPYTGTTVPDLLPEGMSLRSLPDGTKDTLNLSYLRPSTREGWAWYSREVVQRVGELDLGEQTWRKGNRNYDDTGYIFNNYNATNIAPLAKSGLCASYANVPNFAYNAANERLLYGQFALKQSLGANGWLMVCDEYAAANDFKAAVSGVTVLYPLITPTTTTLDPIELPELPAPTATVWCDGGNAQPSYTMEYVKDANLVVQQLEAAIADLATN